MSYKVDLKCDAVVSCVDKVQAQLTSVYDIYGKKEVYVEKATADFKLFIDKRHAASSFFVPGKRYVITIEEQE